MNEQRKASVYLFPAGHGGRVGPYKASVARLGIVFPEGRKATQFGSEFRALNAERIPLGEFVVCGVHVMNFEEARPFMRDEEGFYIFEGTRLIGVGIWRAEGSAR